MININLIISFCLLISLSSSLLTYVYAQDDNNGCKVLKQKLHKMTDISIDENSTGNITKKAQDVLNVLHDYISECYN